MLNANHLSKRREGLKVENCGMKFREHLHKSKGAVGLLLGGVMSICK